MFRTGLLALAALVALPTTAAAQIEIRSGHDMNLRVRGDRRAYTLVSDTVLAFSAEGPGELTLTLRQDFGRGQRPGRTRTKVLMSQDGGPLPPVLLKKARGPRWRGPRKTRASRAEVVTVQVPEGRHRYMLRVATRGHRVAVAMSFEAAAPAELALVPLAPIGDAGDAGDDEIPLAGLSPARDDAGDIPLAALGPAGGEPEAEIPLAGLSSGSGADDGDEIPLAGLSGPGADDGGEIPLAGLSGADDGDAMPLAALGPAGPDDGDDIPLASLGPAEDGDAIPLAALGAPDPDDGEAIPLASLGPAEDGSAAAGDDTGEASTGGRTVAVASRGPEPTGTTGALLGGPLHEPKAPRAPGPITLSLRGLAGGTGMGSGAIGGGADVFYRTALLGGRLSFGVSADVIPYQLKLQIYRSDGSILRSTVPVQALPVLASAAYVLPGEGPLRWQGTAGLGLVHASASEGRRKGSAMLLGGALGFGPLLQAGPGHLTASVRITGSYGGIRDGNGAPILDGPVGGLGLTMGYQLRL